MFYGIIVFVAVIIFLLIDIRNEKKRTGKNISQKRIKFSVSEITLLVICGGVATLLFGVLLYFTLGSIAGYFLPYTNDIIIEQQIYDVSNDKLLTPDGIINIEYADDVKILKGDYELHAKIYKYGEFKENWYKWFAIERDRDSDYAIHKVELYVPEDYEIKLDETGESIWVEKGN